MENTTDSSTADNVIPLNTDFRPTYNVWSGDDGPFSMNLNRELSTQDWEEAEKLADKLHGDKRGVLINEQHNPNVVHVESSIDIANGGELTLSKQHSNPTRYTDAHWEGVVFDFNPPKIEIDNTPAVVNSIEQLPEQDKKLKLPNMDEEVRKNLARMWPGRNASGPQLAAQSDTAPEPEAAIPAHVLKGYVQVGNQYHHKDNPDTPAFADVGNKLETALNNDGVASDLVAIAEHRGWTTIRVNGADEFKRPVWIEASLKGMSVEGYTPNDRDKAELQKRAEALNLPMNSIALANSIEQVVAQEQQHDRTAEATPAKTKSEPGRAPAQSGIYAGTLVDHGAAPYKFDDKEQDSYYATLRKPDGHDLTLWGKDIESALGKASAEKGKPVTLEYLGRQPVTVSAPVRDEKGELVYDNGQVRYDLIETHVNKWQANVDPELAKATALEQAGDRFPNAKIVPVTDAQLEKSSFAGKIIAQDSTHVVQQLGANKLISHDRGAIDHKGHIPTDKFLKVEYTQGRGRLAGQENQQQRGHDVSR